ncbi:NIPSNAP family protein [Alloalcanivorax gelatiniphagus]
MIVEEQQYKVQVGKVTALLDAYEQRGLAILRRNLGMLLGCWSSDVGGDMDVMIQMWAFQDASDRAERRAALATDTDWQSFASEFGHLITERRMRLLTPAAFSPAVVRE